MASLFILVDVSPPHTVLGCQVVCTHGATAAVRIQLGSKLHGGGVVGSVGAHEWHIHVCVSACVCVCVLCGMCKCVWACVCACACVHHAQCVWLRGLHWLDSSRFQFSWWVSESVHPLTPFTK